MEARVAVAAAQVLVALRQMLHTETMAEILAGVGVVKEARGGLLVLLATAAQAAQRPQALFPVHP
jgi:hypothetical protein